MASLITLSRVSKSYNDVLAVDAVDIEIGAREWIFLVGENGAGKSSLLRLLTREEAPSSGHVLMEGRNITRYSRKQLALLRRKIACVWQDIRLIERKTVWENVAFALEVRNIHGALLHGAVEYALDFVGMSDYRDRFPHELSGGEQQRVAIARALVLPPKVMVADEPTSNLSPMQRANLIQLLRKIHREYGVTLIVATHDVEMVNSERQRVLVMEQGRMLADVPNGTYHQALALASAHASQALVAN